MADVNASLDSLVPDAKNIVLRDTGVKTALDRANAKMPITYVIRYRDVFAGRDFMVCNVFSRRRKKQNVFARLAIKICLVVKLGILGFKIPFF